MWVEFAVGSLLCSERFFSGALRFSSLHKHQQFDLDTVDEEPLRENATENPHLLFILFIYYFLLPLDEHRHPF